MSYRKIGCKDVSWSQVLGSNGGDFGVSFIISSRFTCHIDRSYDNCRLLQDVACVVNTVPHRFNANIIQMVSLFCFKTFGEFGSVFKSCVANNSG
jgi:hypothetical protein